MSSSFSGTIITVGFGKDYSSIQTAINNATHGDVILIDPGTYEEILSLDKQIHLIGNTTDLDSNTVNIKLTSSNDLIDYSNISSEYSPIGDGNIFIENLHVENGDRSWNDLLVLDTSINSALNFYINKCYFDGSGGSIYCISELSNSNVGLYVQYCYIKKGYNWFKDIGSTSRWEITNCLFNGDPDTFGADVEDFVVSPTINYGYNYGTDYYSEYSIEGTVKEEGINKQRTVRLYKRSTGALIESTTSLTDGSFSFGLSNNSDEYYVVVLDDESGDSYNALIYDKVQAA